jgi:hypothetical protein
MPFHFEVKVCDGAGIPGIETDPIAQTSSAGPRVVSS